MHFDRPSRRTQELVVIAVVLVLVLVLVALVAAIWTMPSWREEEGGVTKVSARSSALVGACYPASPVGVAGA